MTPQTDHEVVESSATSKAEPPQPRISHTLTILTVVPMAFGLVLATTGFVQYLTAPASTPYDVHFALSSFQVDAPVTQPVFVMSLGLGLLIVPGALVLKFGSKDALAVLWSLLAIVGFGTMAAETVLNSNLQYAEAVSAGTIVLILGGALVLFLAVAVSAYLLFTRQGTLTPTRRK